MEAAEETTVNNEFDASTGIEFVTSFDVDFEAVEVRCGNCYSYWNRVCSRCSRCGSQEYTPCLHCDLNLR